MSLKSKRLQPWDTLKHHPVVTVPLRRSKRPQTRSLQASSKRPSSTSPAGKPAHPNPSDKAAAGRFNQKQQSLSVALHANASSLLPSMASPLQDGLCPVPAARLAASEFSIGDIHSVLAMGTSGPVYHARYKQHTFVVTQTSKASSTPVLVVPLAFACMCAL